MKGNGGSTGVVVTKTWWRHCVNFLWKWKFDASVCVQVNWNLYVCGTGLWLNLCQWSVPYVTLHAAAAAAAVWIFLWHLYQYQLTISETGNLYIVSYEKLMKPYIFCIFCKIIQIGNFTWLSFRNVKYLDWILCLQEL